MVYKQFQAIVQKQPSVMAVFSGVQQLSYLELNERILEFAAALANQGVGLGSVIAVALPNSIEFVIATFAGFRLGAVVLPLNVNYTDHEIEIYLQKSGAVWVVGNTDQIERIRKLDIQVATINIESVADVSSLPDISVLNLHPALVMFSSGSTGGAKQVTRTYQNLMAEWQAAKDSIGITETDVILCSVPMYHAHGFSNCILAALLNGASLVITLGEFNPRAIVKALIQYQVSIYPSATFMLKMLTSIRLKEKPDPERLRLVYSAGASLDSRVISDFSEAFSITPNQLYGSTETGAVSINLGAGPVNSVGKAFVNTSIMILDEKGDSKARGDTGEIVISSSATAIRYDGMPEQSVLAFKYGFYYTGDLGYIDEAGYIFITGRKKRMINVAGLKVDPTEVESVLAALSGVKEVVVLGKEDGDYGELVKAVIVADEGLTEADIITCCKSHLAEYKWPKSIEFRKEIPKNAMGKILKKYL
ncbi:MAG: long-chain acyl-CoA synthetase [Paraglaciecola sp.]|jgi:long-chain acyl-CoA synthetase